MPVESTESALNNCTIGSRCGAKALMAKNYLALVVFQSEVIRSFVVAWTIPGILLAGVIPTGHQMNLLCLWLDRFLILSLCSCLDIFEVFSNVLGEMESTRVLPVQMRKQNSKATDLIIDHGWIGFAGADITEPRLVWQRIFAHWWINALVME